MTQEELDRQLVEDKNNLDVSKEAFREAKASLRKARLTSISNKLLAPYRRFQISLAIIKYDAMIEKIEKERARAVERARKLEEKEQKEIRKQNKANFKEAIRDKRKEDIISFVNDTKFNAETLFNENIQKGKKALDKVNGSIKSASCFMSNVKSSVIAYMDKNTTLHKDIESKILDIKLDRAKKAYERELENRQQQEEFVNMETNEKIDKVSKQKSYMGTATNRVVDYFKNKKSKVDEKIVNLKIDAHHNAYVISSKISSTKSKLTTVFNTQINKFRSNVDNFIGDVMVTASDKISDIKTNINDTKDNVMQKVESIRNERQRKEDMTIALNTQTAKDNSIKRAQLESMRQALGEVNNTSDIFANSTSLENVGKIK